MSVYKGCEEFELIEVSVYKGCEEFELIEVNVYMVVAKYDHQGASHNSIFAI